MAASEPSRYLARSLPRAFAPSSRAPAFCWRRNASDQASTRSPSAAINDLESTTLSTPLSEDTVKSFNPLERARARKTQLPRSRYVTSKIQTLGFTALQQASTITTNTKHLVINSARPNTTVVLFTLTGPLRPLIPPLDSSSPAPSPFPVSHRPGNPPSHRTSSPSSTSTTPRDSSLRRRLPVSVHGMTAPRTTRIDLSVALVAVTFSASSANRSPSTTSPRLSASLSTVTSSRLPSTTHHGCTSPVWPCRP